MITRLLSALGSVGISRVLMMPDVDGIAHRVRRAVDLRPPPGQVWPEVVFLDMPIECGPDDSVHAVERMVAAGVGAIVVLGGDGTNRLVASACGETPILPLSTGTNNVFPRVREATIAGLAAGLVAAGRVPTAETLAKNKVLAVEVNGVSRGPALVDVAIASDLWVGSRAVWRSESLRQLFVTFAEADAIGLSSIAGLLRPVSRQATHGLRVDISSPETAEVTLMAPIAPGLIVPVGVNRVEEILPGNEQTVQISQGVIALDGEREIEFAPTDRVIIRLEDNGPLTIDIDWVMAQAAREGLLTGGCSSDFSN
jgi:predicted polyphosphate/ATP-dependent NAD kinase